MSKTHILLQYHALLHNVYNCYNITVLCQYIMMKPRIKGFSLLAML